jgi:O-antigen ligase
VSAALPTEAVAGTAPAPVGERVYQGVLTFALALLGLFVPFSTAGASIALAILALLCVVSPRRILATRFWREPFFIIGFLLLAYIALRTLLGEGFSAASFRWINHYQELLILPLLWAVFSNARRPQAFALGLVIGVAYLAVMYWVFGSTMDQTFGLKLLSHRISAGFVLAVCAYLLFEHARLQRLPAWIGFGGAALLVGTVFAVIDGRTGHIIVLLLIACAAFRAAPRRARMATTLAVIVAAVAVAALSPTVRHRALETFHDTEAAEHGQGVENSSTSIRIEILRNAVTVAREHWVLGTGWDHYAGAIAEVAHRRHSDPKAVLGALSVNPHNEYLLQLAAGGVPALLLFLAWLAWPVWAAVRNGGPDKPWTGAIACVALAFAVGCLFNSLLLDFTEAHFYAALAAWLLARRREA